MTDAPPPSAQWRERLLEAALEEAPFSGWTNASLAAAAKAAGLSEGQAALAVPGGVQDLLNLFEDRADAAMLANAQFGSNSLRGRVKTLVMARLRHMQRHREALRRAGPHGALAAPGWMWRTADRIWRALGDPSTDYNFYSKRTILTGVLAATMLVFLVDETEELSETEAFLTRRLDGVMAFEKAKAAVAKLVPDSGPVLDALARMRFGR
jgi:ubiquinone biosynthesis protein COQ9